MDEQSQVLHPSPAEDVAIECLFGVADRQLMVLDTCREFTPSPPTLMSGSCVSAPDYFESERKQYRRVYDHYISKCEPSHQIAYACQAGGSARVGPYGSIYTRTLVQRALRWELPSRLRHGFASIRRLMRKPNYNGEQPGYYHSGNGIKPRCFPFAIGVI